ncbi:MAG: thioredoxin family protein [Cyclobacteriaceae bacterium]
MKNYNIIIPVAILAAMTALLVSVGNKSVVEGGYEVGDIAANFSLKNVDGAEVSLSDYNDSKGAIVIFTCNSCPFSQMYEDRIIQLQAKYEQKGFPVIAINPNDPQKQPADSYDKMKIRSAEKSFNFPYLIDETQETVSAYGASRTPHVFVLNRESKDQFRVAYIGAIDNNHKDAATADKKYVEDAVDALIDGKVVPTTFTKAIGCTIKWKG